jgi:undecaprenyl-diphosphatase
MDFGFIFIHQFAGTSSLLDGIAIFFAQYSAYLFSICFIIGAFYQKSWRARFALFLFTSLSVLTVSGLIKGIINYAFPIDRPFVAQSFTPLIDQLSTPSFPSGHTTFFFTIATVIFISMSARWGIVAYFVAGLIGLARVFVGVHYPADILGGIVLGILVPFAVMYIVPNLRFAKNQTKEIEESVENTEQTL